MARHSPFTAVLALLIALAPSLAGATALQPPSIQLVLTGTVTGGASVTDQAAYVRLLPNALQGWDVNDASKLFPLAAPYSLLAPVGERDGERYRLSVNSLPDGSPGTLSEPVVVPVDFLSTEAGSFSITWNGASALPAGWGAFLRDYATGAVTDMETSASYAFSAGATDWTERFQLVLVPSGVTAQVNVVDGAGWRLLSAPVSGLTVTDLAEHNLVQGVAAGTPAATFPAQYPGEGANLFTGYAGAAYVSPAHSDEGIEPGRGFFWYWYDGDYGPFPGGTSQSRELQGFVLSASGTPNTLDVTRVFAATADDFYMVGNPFSQPLAVTGLTTEAPLTLITTLQTFDPAGGGSYVPLFANNPETNETDLIAPWQGAFAQVSSNPTGLSPTVHYDAASIVDGGVAPFYGKSPENNAYLHMVLVGQTLSGVNVRDEASWIRFLPDALFGWDRHDSSKLIPLQIPYTLIAPIGERDGAPYRLSVNSLPSTFEGPISVPVDVASTDAGAMALTWTGASSFDLSRTLDLFDEQLGSSVDMRSSDSYPFTQVESDWSRRFEIRIGAAAVAAENGPEASALSLSAPRPNPVSNRTTLSLFVPSSQRILATLVDALGRTVRTVIDRQVEAGTVMVGVDVGTLAPGVYSVRVQGATMLLTQRLLVAR